MNDLLISLLVFAVLFGGALIGVAVRPFLLERHLQPDSRDVVKMATGLIGTLAALVLGLLIASAKSTYDQKTNQVRQLTATVILLDDLLAQYGPEAAPSEISCGGAFNRSPIAFGTSKGFRAASRRVSRRVLSPWHSKKNWSTCRRPMMRNARCNLAPFRPSQKARRYVCSCLRRPPVQFRSRF